MYDLYQQGPRGLSWGVSTGWESVDNVYKVGPCSSSTSASALCKVHKLAAEVVARLESHTDISLSHGSVSVGVHNCLSRCKFACGF